MAGVKVHFIDPDHYIDANLRHAYGKTAKEPAMREIENFLSQLGERYLAPDETLTVDVLDIDLAGRFEPWHWNYQDVRFMRDYTWPSIKLRYRLEGPTGTIASGEETVSDQSYQFNAAFGSDLETMRYEKTMLERWFRQRFKVSK
jgi:hypothetical protein